MAASQRELVHSEDAEGWKNVLHEVLVLVITEHEHEVGLEVVNSLTGGGVALQQLGAMLSRGGEAFVRAPLSAQRRGPVAGILPLGGSLFAVQIVAEVHVGHGLVGEP